MRDGEGELQEIKEDNRFPPQLDVRGRRIVTKNFSEFRFGEPIDEHDSIRSFDPEWEPKIKKKWGKRIPPDQSVKERTHYLWAKLRVACRQPGLLEDLENERDLYLDRKFGLRDFNTLVPSDEEAELDESKKISMLHDRQQNKLPWYLLSDDTKFAKGQKIFVQIMTWSTVLITPLTFLFPDLKE